MPTRKGRIAEGCGFWYLLLCMGGMMALFPRPVRAAGFYPPGLRWWRAETQHFVFYVDAAVRDRLPELARWAEWAYTQVTRDLGRTVDRVTVVVTDHMDLASGFANLYPTPHIFITAAPPRVGDLLGDYGRWYRLVLVHELTHLVQLSDGPGWFRFLRRVFGPLPVFYPGLLAPDWYTEGLATLEETRWTEGGRACSVETRALVETFRRAGQVPPLDRGWTSLVHWPLGHFPYHFGSAFLMSLAGQSETDIDRLFEVLRNKDRTWLPFFLDRGEKRAWGTTFGRRWRQWWSGDGRGMGTSEPASSEALPVLRPGFELARLFPVGKRLCFYMQRPHEYPGIFCWRPGQARMQRVTEAIAAEGFGVSPGSRYLVVPEIDRRRTYWLGYRLRVRDRKTGRRFRMGKNFRVLAADVNEWGEIAATRLRPGDRSELMIYETQSGRYRTLAVQSGLYQAPRWSPDGQRFAVIHHDATGIICIEVWSRDGTRERRLFCGPQRKLDPAWSPDGRYLLFVMEVQGRFQIFRFGYPGGILERLRADSVLLRAPAPTDQGLYALGLTPNGYAIVRFPRPQWQMVAHLDFREDPRMCPIRAVTRASSEPDGPAWKRPPRPAPVRPIVRPAAFAPWVSGSRTNPRLGGVLLGQDVRDYSAYRVELFYQPQVQRWGYRARYRLDTGYPRLFLRSEQTAAPFGDGAVQEDREHSLSLQVPVWHIRWQAGLVLGVKYESVRVRPAGDAPWLSAHQWSIPVSLYYNRALRYGYSVSPEDGFTLVGLGRFGIDPRVYRTLGFSLRAYLDGLGRHHVLALRGVALKSFGPDLELLSVGGESDDLGPIRGVPASPGYARSGWGLNLEYRFPLVEIQRGLDAVPVFFHRLHGALFVDHFRIRYHPRMREIDPTLGSRDRFTSVGLELRLDLEWVHVVRTVLRAGVALGPGGLRNRRFYVRLGLPF